MLRFLSVFAFLLAFTLTAQAGPKEFYYERYMRSLEDKKDPLPKAVKSGTRADVFNQRLNWDGNDDRTFEQRYFVNSTYAKGDTPPVIYVICGEATCSENEFRGAIVSHARRIGAHLVALEHRYYGASHPFPEMTVENLEYLKTEFAVEDLANFQRHAMEELGMTGKWIAVGGSYAGSLAAYYRMKHPDLVSGALASSAPVQPHVNFEEYDLSVSKAVGEECGAAMRKVVHEIEDVLRDEDELTRIKELFEAQEIVEPVDFLYVVADMAAMAVQYGNKDEFCEILMQNEEATIETYAEAGLEMIRKFNVSALQLSFQSAESENADDYLDGFGMRAWMYQSCTEYGYFQNAYNDPEVSVRSSLISAEYHQEVCERLFGINDEVNTEKIQTEFYEPLLDSSKTSRVFFTNGDLDPWSLLSILPDGENNKNPDIDTMLMEGAAHCEDLGSKSSTSIRATLAAFVERLKSWIE